MPKERLQLLIEPRQRQLLDRESRQTGKPVGELIREAIDARLDPHRARKEEAMEEIRNRRIEVSLTPEEIERMIQSEHDL